MSKRCDIFCDVIDNYGDIGVCWRLARQLAREHGLSVRLWVNDQQPFAQLAPTLDPSQADQTLGEISVCRWSPELKGVTPADIVIEGFACALPADYLAAMRQSRPLWLNLEYLSAEDWVEDCHGLASLNPATGLSQHFWFPGFTPRTGGLLREAGLLEARDRFQADPQAQAAFWQRIGVPDALDHTHRISLFSYENPAISDLLEACSMGAASSLVLVPTGRALADVRSWTQQPELQAGDRLTVGNTTLAILPLLPHEDYDRLLWACTLNFIRGEDSFVRAQWAGRPLIWHIYPQDEAAHLAKLEAFIHRVEHQSGVPAAWAEAMRAWNAPAAGPSTWETLLADLPEITVAGQSWGRLLADQTDLASGLVHFFRRQVE